MARILFCLFSFLIISSSAIAARILPPVLVQKEIYQWPEPPKGIVVELDAPTSTTFVLFIPEDTRYNDDSGTTLTIHFHGAAWFMRQEHTRRDAHHPLLVGNAKEADAVFETDIMQDDVLEALLQQTAKALVESGASAEAHIDRLELSGFSAGYAGVRGVLRLPEFEPMVARVMLNDSVYVGDGPDSSPPDDRKPRPGPDGIGPFLDFARKAATGERTLLMEFSTTPSMRSVGPMDCARAIIDALGIAVNEVETDSIPAARPTADYQIIWRADKGNAHFWCYDSPSGKPIHLAHVRNQGNMWRALDGCTSVRSQPPPMPTRPINPTDPLPGESIALDFPATGTVTLFVPANYKVPKDGAVELTVHFHGATWFAIQEHLRRGLGDPLVALELGQGSTVYREPFEDSERLAQLMDSVVAALRERGAPAGTHIESLNLTSFSAGYGAIREIIKLPEYVAIIKRVLLGDSSYGSLDEEALEEGDRVVAPEHVEPWANFAKHAVAGDKTLLMLTSDIMPETYAGTMEVGRAVSETIAAEIVTVESGSIPASDESLEYPLHTRADKRSFHWWAYAGEDAIVHMTLARHIAEAWEALDQHGDP